MEIILVNHNHSWAPESALRHHVFKSGTGSGLVPTMEMDTTSMSILPVLVVKGIPPLNVQAARSDRIILKKNHMYMPECR